MLVALVCNICLIYLCCVVLPQASEEELIGVFADMIVPHVTLPEGQVSSGEGLIEGCEEPENSFLGGGGSISCQLATCSGKEASYQGTEAMKLWA
jgi:hypothetical protein